MCFVAGQKERAPIAVNRRGCTTYKLLASTTSLAEAGTATVCIAQANKLFPILFQKTRRHQKKSSSVFEISTPKISQKQLKNRENHEKNFVA